MVSDFLIKKKIRAETQYYNLNSKHIYILI